MILTDKISAGLVTSDPDTSQLFDTQDRKAERVSSVENFARLHRLFSGPERPHRRILKVTCVSRKTDRRSS